MQYQFERRFSIAMSSAIVASLTIAQKTESQRRDGAESVHIDADKRDRPSTILITIGDSLTHGTMDATNNSRNTLHAYAELVAQSLNKVINLRFVQPLWDDEQTRIDPYQVPTNLGVDGADIFSAEGLEYYKTVGADENILTADYLCDARTPRRFDGKYDKVLFPLNRVGRHDVAQIDAAVELLERHLADDVRNEAIVILWLGNNDSSTAALGSGGENPMFIPLPVEQIESELSPGLRLLLNAAQRIGLVSTDSYSQATIERNMTDLADFAAQYGHIVDRLATDERLAEGRTRFFLLTLPYYSSVGYLIDSEDMEYYFRKRNSEYSVPASFRRVAPDGGAIVDPLAGDRISLLTFGLMYTLLATGHGIDEVNAVLETDGVQNDGMVLSEGEQRSISSRIDEFNSVIRKNASSRGAFVQEIDAGKFLNDGLGGAVEISVGGKVLNRKWTRGSGFTLDGVHPGYTAQALIANYVLVDLNAVMGWNAPLYDLESVSVTDPYVDKDGDGFAPGPDAPAHGLGELLFLLTDQDDANQKIAENIPENVWDIISSAVLDEVLGVDLIHREAQRLGIDRSTK